MSMPWDKLISSTMTPTTAVAVKLAVTEEPSHAPDSLEDQDRCPLSSLHDRFRSFGRFSLLDNKSQPPPASPPLFRSVYICSEFLRDVGYQRSPNARNHQSITPIITAQARTTTTMNLEPSNGGSRIYFWRYRQARFSSRRVRKRVVFKHGDCNVVQGNVAKRRRRYLQDIFTTLVDAQWRWTLLVFALNFILSWLAFAVIWWLIVVSHGDLEPHTDDNITWVPCVEGVHSFTSVFLFSVETQHTIGYGNKHTTDECPEAVFVMCLQSIVGVMIQAFMVGIVFAKLSRPKKRTQTLLFSRNAVICQRNGQLCLMFRVGDMRKSHIIEAHVRAQLIRKTITQEGEVLPFCQQELKVGGDGVEDRIFFIWPTTIVHKITKQSPLYNVSAADMLQEKFEIVVILEGVIESTGMTTQARSSYLPNEILWGHRFSNMVSFKKETGEHEVDYSQFNNTYEVDTPLCSAHSLNQLLRESRLHEHLSTTSTSSIIIDVKNGDVSSSSSTCSNPELHHLFTCESAEQLQLQVVPSSMTTVPSSNKENVVITLEPNSTAIFQHSSLIPGPESDI